MAGMGLAQPIVTMSEAQAYVRIETGEEEAVLAGLVRSASALCEAFLGRVVIARPFSMDVAASSDWQRLGLTPVGAIDTVASVVNWSQARLRFDAGPGVRGDAELETLLAFYRARRGPAVGFRFRDPYDNSSNAMTGEAGASDQAIGAGDGVNQSFALVKTYGEGEARRITRPVAGSVRVAINGSEMASGWSLLDKGVVQFAQAPAADAAVTAGYQFDTPVRFADDRLEINRSTFRAGEAPSVPLIEIRED